MTAAGWPWPYGVCSRWPLTYHIYTCGAGGTFPNPLQNSPSFHLLTLGLPRPSTGAPLDLETPSAFPAELKARCLSVLPKDSVSAISTPEIKTNSLIIWIQSEMLVSVWNTLSGFALFIWSWNITQFLARIKNPPHFALKWWNTLSTLFLSEASSASSSPGLRQYSAVREVLTKLKYYPCASYKWHLNWPSQAKVLLWAAGSGWQSRSELESHSRASSMCVSKTNIPCFGHAADAGAPARMSTR